MRILLFLEKSPLPFCALAGCLCLGVQSLSGQPATLQQRITSAGGRVEDIEQRTGPFAIAGQNYTVVLHGKRLVNVSDPTLVQTVAGVEISDATGNVSYRKIFPYAIEQDRFQRSLSASAQLASGKTGAGLVIHYREQMAVSQTSALQTSESWQLFGLVNGKLAPLGKPVPIGEGVTGGPFMGVMMRAANGTEHSIERATTGGSSDRLQVHHMCSRSLLGDDIDENLITLCADCQSDIHRSSSSYRTRLLV
jgi:hypothetical protein